MRLRTRLLPLVLIVAAAGLATAPAAPAKYHLLKAFWGTGSTGDLWTFRDLGVRIVQLQLRWNEIAPHRPKHPRDPHDRAYHWPSDVNHAIGPAGRRHMRVLLMPFFTPGWANGGRSKEFAPSRTRSYTDFLYAATRRYRSVHLWMIWGEANGKNFRPQSGSAPRAYARLLDASYGVLKKRSKKNKVIGGSSFTAGTTRPFYWVQGMRLAHHRRPRLDLYAHNPFTRRKPDLSNPPSGNGTADFSDLRRFGRAVDHNLGRSHHRHIPLFISEWCEPTPGPDSEFRWHVSNSQQADWIRAAFKVARQVRAYGFGWIHLQDAGPTPSGYASRCGLVTEGGQKKPGYYAFKQSR